MTDGSGSTPPPQDPTGAPSSQQFPPPAGQPVQPPPQGAPVPGNPAPGAPGPAYPSGAPAPGAPAPGSPGAGYDYGAPPPGSEPPPEKKKSRKVLYIVLAIILLPILGIGGCAAALFYAARGPIDATNDYLALLDEQRYGEAFDELVPGCLGLNREQFIEAMTPVDITGYDISGVGTSTTDGTTTSGTITLAADDREHPIRFELREIDGTWKVCTFDFDFEPAN